MYKYFVGLVYGMVEASLNLKGRDTRCLLLTGRKAIS